jgi:hypothetical protein
MQNLLPMPAAKPQAEKSGEALFDFDDLQAVRDEYDERIARLERERDATIDVLKREAENRLNTLKRDYDQRAQLEAASRQELIYELTFELAAAREEGERRAQEADKRRLVVEAQLHASLSELGRIEADVQRLKATLTAAIAPTVPATPIAVPQPAVPQPAASIVPQPTSFAAPPALPADAQVLSPGLQAFAGVRKKKIRLR